jgi:branched-chain amino acid transport system ATP-binding protein
MAQVSGRGERKPMQEKSSKTVLKCEGLTKRFAGLEAVKNVNLEIAAGERRGLIGPNGAGKTTLFCLINGMHSVTSGSIRLFDRDITHLPSYRRTYMGLGRTFQITNLFPTLTVIENIVVGIMGLRRMKFSMLKPLSGYRELYDSAIEVMERVGIAEKRGQVTKNLSYGEQRQVEICLALASNPKLLLLDEPTAGLSPADTVMVTETIRKLDPTITLFMIEHNMDVALQITDRLTVMHQGAVFAEGTPMEICNNLQVQEIYFGTEEVCGQQEWLAAKQEREAERAEN